RSLHGCQSVHGRPRAAVAPRLLDEALDPRQRQTIEPRPVSAPYRRDREIGGRRLLCLAGPKNLPAHHSRMSSRMNTALIQALTFLCTVDSHGEGIAVTAPLERTARITTVEPWRFDGCARNWGRGSRCRSHDGERLLRVCVKGDWALEKLVHNP